jgi:hypothetical protein
MKKSRRLNIRRRRRSIKGGKPPSKLYQAKLIDLIHFIKPEFLSDNSEIEIRANEYVQIEENQVNIGDILFCGTTRDRQEYGFYLVLPDGENKVVKCLGEGWGMGWISGGVIDHKDILHRYNVKYDVLLGQKSGIYEFDMYFLGHIESSMPPQIIEEFKQNKLIS